MIRKTLEVILVAFAGVLALAFPLLTGQSCRGHTAAFLPVMADVVKGIRGSSLLLLFAVNVVAGMFGKSPPLLLGCTSVALLPIWSAVDAHMGSGGHNLLPFELLFYGTYALIGISGAFVGRRAGRKCRVYRTRKGRTQHAEHDEAQRTL